MRLDHRGEQNGNAAAKDQADGDAKQGQNADLQGVSRKDGAACGTERFQDRDGAGFVAQIGAHSSADANAADGKARQAHKDQEGANALYKTGGAACTFAAIAPAHASVAELAVGAVL